MTVKLSEFKIIRTHLSLITAAPQRGGGGVSGTRRVSEEGSNEDWRDSCAEQPCPRAGETISPRCSRLPCSHNASSAAQPSHTSTVMSCVLRAPRVCRSVEKATVSQHNRLSFRTDMVSSFCDCFIFFVISRKMYAGKTTNSLTLH